MKLLSSPGFSARMGLWSHQRHADLAGVLVGCAAEVRHAVVQVMGCVLSRWCEDPFFSYLPARATDLAPIPQSGCWMGCLTPTP